MVKRHDLGGSVWGLGVVPITLPAVWRLRTMGPMKRPHEIFGPMAVMGLFAPGLNSIMRSLNFGDRCACVVSEAVFTLRDWAGCRKLG